jgi:hypothetical protein
MSCPVAPDGRGFGRRRQGARRRLAPLPCVRPPAGPEQVISRIDAMDGASLYKITDDHYVCVTCCDQQHRHKGRALLKRVLPQDWECFASAVNVGDGTEVFHYGPAT